MPSDRSKRRNRLGVREIRYGRWLILQNMTATPKLGEEEGSTAIAAPIASLGTERDLVSGKHVNLNEPIELPPYTTMVFDLQATVQ